jgi:hypothetical protein
MLDAARLVAWTPARIRTRIGTRTPASRVALRAFASVAVIAAAFLVAAWIGRTPPFEGRMHDPFSETAVLRAVPYDAPLPQDMSLVAAGRGDDLAYHVQWTSPASTTALVDAFESRLDDSPKWRTTHAETAGGALTTTLARLGSDGYMTHFARLTFRPEGEQSIVGLEFTPVPVSLVER